eukprot:7596055-Pyramimonas_sp.AAC.1
MSLRTRKDVQVVVESSMTEKDSPSRTSFSEHEKTPCSPTEDYIHPSPPPPPERTLPARRPRPKHFPTPLDPQKRSRTVGAMTPAVAVFVGWAFVIQEGRVTIELDGA